MSDREQELIDTFGELYTLHPAMSEALDKQAGAEGTGIKAILMVLDADGLFADASVETLDRYIDLAEHPYKCLLAGASTPTNAGPLTRRLGQR